MTMPCDDLGERLSALLDGELSGRERAELDDHLARCPACAARRARLERAAGAVGALEGLEPRAGFLDRLDARMRRELRADGLDAHAHGAGASAPSPSPSGGGAPPRGLGLGARSGRSGALRDLPPASGLARAARLGWALLGRGAIAAAFIVSGYLFREALVQRERGATAARSGVAPARTEWLPAGETPARDRRGAAGEPAGRRPTGEASDAGASASAPAGASEPGRGVSARPDPALDRPDAAGPEGSDLARADLGPATAEGDRGGLATPAAAAGGPALPPRGSGDDAVAAAEPVDPLPGGAGTGAPKSDPRARAAAERALLRRFRAASTLADQAAILHELARSAGPDAIGLFRELVVRRPARYGALVDEAIAALGAWPSREGLWVLAQAARDRPLEVRAALARVDDALLLAWAGASLLPELDEARFPDARLLLADALAAGLGERAGPALVRALEATREPQGRAHLLAALGRAGGEPALTALASALEDRRAELRAAAGRGLALFIEGAARAARGEAALGADGGAGLRARLARICESDRSAPARAAATAALGRLERLGRAEGVEALLARRDLDPAALVRSEAQLALMRISGEGLFAPDEWSAWRARGAGAAGGAAPPGVFAVLAAERVPESYHGLPVLSDGAVFVLDVSESMRQGEKLARARRELERTLRALPAGTPFNVGVFADGAAFAFRRGLERATPGTIAEALAFVDARRPEGGRTDLGLALERAFGIDGVDQVFLLSDGAPTAGLAADGVVEATRRLAWTGAVRLHAIGLYTGDGAFRPDDPARAAPPPIAFLRDLAAATGGVFVRND